MASKSSPVQKNLKETPRRSLRRSSLQSPARSRLSGKMSSIINDSLLKHSVLSDNTDVTDIERSRWWEILGDQSQNVMEVLEKNKYETAKDTIKTVEFTSKENDPNNFLNDLGVEVLSQEKRNYSLDLPESSDNETIHSIILPERRVFNQKENKSKPKKLVLGKLLGARETLANNQPRKSQGFDLKAAARQKQIFGQGPVKNTGNKIAALINISNKSNDENINNKMQKKYFNESILSKSKPAFPTALLDISHDKTAPNRDKTIDTKLRPLFGQRKATKRNNMYAQFINDESMNQTSAAPVEQKNETENDHSEAEADLSFGKGEIEDGPEEIESDKELNESEQEPEQSEEELNYDESEEEKEESQVIEGDEGNTDDNEAIDDFGIDDLSAIRNNESHVEEADEEKEQDVIDASEKQINNSNNDVKDKNEKSQELKKEEQEKTRELDADNNEKQDNMEVDVVMNDENDMIQVPKEIKQSKIDEKENNLMMESNEVHNESLTVDVKNDSIRRNSLKRNASMAVSPAMTRSAKTSLNSSNFEANATLDSTERKRQKLNSSIRATPEIARSQRITRNSLLNVKDILTLEVEEKTKHKNDDVIIESDEQINNSIIVEKQRKIIQQVSEKDQVVDKEIEKDQEVDGEIEKGQEVDGEIEKGQEVDKEIEKDQEVDGEIEKSPKVDKEIEKDQEVDEKIEKDQEVDEEIEKDLELFKEIEKVQDSRQEIEENREAVIENESILQDEEENEEREYEEIQENKKRLQEEVEKERSQEDNEEQLEEENEMSLQGEEKEKFPEDHERQLESEEENEEESEISLQYEEDEEDKELSLQYEEDEAEKEISQENIEVDEEHLDSEVENEERLEDEEEIDESQVLDEKNQESQVIDEEDQESQEVEEENDEVNDNDQESEDNVINKQDLSQDIDDEIDKSQDMAQQEDTNQVYDDEVDKDETDRDQEDDHSNDENVEPKENEASKYFENIDEKSEANVTHDTTGRNRQKRNASIIASPEIALSEKLSPNSSFQARGRNTSVRKTVHLIDKPETEMASIRSSTGLSDGTKNSTAEGSGWDSHRVTKKTLRMTFGKDFTPRKSLRTLVMEKSAKRQTLAQLNQAENIPENVTEVSMPQAMDVENSVASDHDTSKMTRQATLDMFLKKMKDDAAKKKQKIKSKVKESLDMGIQVRLKSSSQNWAPVKSYSKSSSQTAKPKPKAKKLAVPIAHLPKGFIEDLNYKPPKRFAPKNASWITNRLYKFLESKLEPKYDYMTRVRAEKFVEKLYDFVQVVRRHDIAPQYLVDELKHDMAVLNIVQTHFDFYEFFEDYLPMEIILSVVPDIKNKIKVPRGGVYTDILQTKQIHT